MKIFTLLHKSNNEGTRIPVLKSRITSTKPLLNHYSVLTVALLLLLGGFSTRAWGADPVACMYINNQQKDINAYNNRTVSGWFGSKTYYYKFHQYEDITSLSAADNKYGVSAISCSVNIDALWGGIGQGATVLLQYKVGTGAWTNVGAAQTCAADGEAKNFSVSGLNIAKNQEVAFRLNVTSYNDNEYTKQRKLTAYLTVSMSKTLSLNSTADMEFSDLVYGTTPNPKDTRTVTFSCESTQKTMSVSCDNNTDFTVALDNTSLGADCDGTRTVTVTFHPQTVGDKSGTVTISSTNGAASTSFDVKGKCTPATPTLILSRTTATIDKTSDVLHPNNFVILSAITTYVGDGKHYDIVASDISSNGHINGDNFYATEPGTYTIRITSPAGDHYGNTFSDNATYRDIVVTVRDKAHPSFNKNYTQETANGLLVDGIIESAFVLENVSVAAGFTWNITHNINSVNNGDGMVIEYDAEKNKIIAHNAGTASLQFVQTGDDDYYDGESEVYTFIVSKHETSFSGSAYNMMVDATQTADYSYTNVSDTKPTASDEDNFYYTIDEVSFTKEAKNNGTNLVTFNPNNKLITACNAGTAKITLHQKETYKYTGATTSFNVAVYKYNSVFANVDDKSVKVGADIASTYSLTYAKPNAAYIETTAPSAAGTPVLGESTNFYYTLTQNVTTDKTAGSPDPSLAITYNAGTKTATGKNAGTGTIHLYQPETYKYNAADEDFVVTVTKNGNALSCKFDNVTSTTWKKTLNFDEYTVATFSSNHTMNAIQVALKAGDSIASYNPSNGRITASCNIGDAIWTVWQPENYMYVGDTAECKVTVDTKTCPTCYAYKNDPDKEASEVNEVGWNIDGIANVLTFDMQKKGTSAGDNALLSWWITDHYTTPIEVTANNIWNYKPADPSSIQLDPHTTKLKFEKGGDWIHTLAGDVRTDDPYINNIRVTRLSWLELNNSQTGAAIVDTIKIIKELGEANKQATFQVKISTCDNTVKLASSDSKVVVGSTSIALPSSSSYDGGYLNQDITLTYHCDHKDTTDAVISVYTKYEHNSFVVRAITKANGQEIVWKSGYENDEVTLPVNTQLSISDAASASSKLTPVLYSTNNPSVILISDDRESFKVIASGIATLTASQAGNSIYEATSDTKTIKATEKQIQEIVWTRSFSHGLVIDDMIPLDAYVDTINAATSSRARSDAQTAKLVYSCPNANGVVEIIEGNKVHILGEGRTQITASVASDEYYEATSYTKSVYVRKPSSGCETHYTYLQKDEEILFFEFDFNVPELNYVITLDPDSGVPDLLSFSVRGEYYKAGAEWYRGHVDAYQSSDGANWSYITTIEPEKGQTLSKSDLPIDRNTTMIKFTRPSASWGYHYVEDVVVTRKQYLETASEIIDLGDVPVGSVRAGKIPISYSEMKTDLLITKGLVDETYNKLELDEPSVEIECGSFGTHDVDFKLKPTHVDDSWSQTVTIEDTISKKSITVTLVANIVQGSQSINWTTNSTINDAQDAPRLNATATSGLQVSYVLTCENNVASIENIGGKDTVMIHRPGSFTITASQAGDANYLAAPNVVKNFTVSNVTYVFNGNGDWNTNSYWNTGEKPADGVDVIINGHVTISGAVSVNSMTINEGNAVTLTVGGQLTVGNGNSQDREHYGDLHVEEQGKVILGTGTLKVNDFILDAVLNGWTDANDPLTSQTGLSGQVTNPGKIVKQGKAYFDLSFDPSGKISFGWYDFTVPFSVNINGGISRIGSTNDCVAQRGVDFLIMEADEADRANGGRGWRDLSGNVLQPGKLYTITFNYSPTFDQNTYRFMWNGEGSMLNGETYAAQYASGSNADLNGWNGMGNGMLRHGYPTGGYKCQAYNHSTNTYELVQGNKTFAVGSAFFVQVKEPVDVNWAPEEASLNRPLFAPTREGREVEEFCLGLTSENEHMDDILYFSASEDATEAYVIGRDLIKMGTPTDSKVARIWATKGGKNLCDVEAALINSNATAPLTIYAPKDGQYTLHIEEMPDDATLYLTYNGRAIWNLNYSPYVLDLTKGMTEGYGLKLYANQAPQVTTGVDEFDAEGQTVRKVMIDNTIYIITPDGAMYDVLGKKCE